MLDNRGTNIKSMRMQLVAKSSSLLCSSLSPPEKIDFSSFVKNVWQNIWISHLKMFEQNILTDAEWFGHLECQKAAAASIGTTLQLHIKDLFSCISNKKLIW